MKRIAGAIISVGLVLALAGCTWRIPQTVSVKTDAEYEFSLGTFEKDLNSELDIQSMLGSSGSGSEIEIYDYFPGKTDSKTQQIMLKIKVLEDDLKTDIPNITGLQAALDSLDDDASVNLQDFTINIDPDKKALDFNPASILSGMDSINAGLSGNINFSSVPLYLYCNATNGLSAKGYLKLYYSSDGNNPRDETELEILPMDSEISNKPLPENLQMEEDTVIADFNKIPALATEDMNGMLNATSIQDGDKLYVEYDFSNISGTFTKGEIESGEVKLAVYAVIVLPLRFVTTDIVNMDLSSMSGTSSGSGSGSGSGSASSNVEVPDEVKKVLNVINGISVKYAANKLPIHKSSGTMELGVDLLNTGVDEDMKWANISDSGKQEVITLPRKTLNAFKESPSFNPNIKIRMTKDTVFSVPREKAVNMYVELSVKTGGKIQVM